MSISDFWHSQHVPQVVPNGTIINPITFAQKLNPRNIYTLAKGKQFCNNKICQVQISFVRVCQNFWITFLLQANQSGSLQTKENNQLLRCTS
jgi:hypothetical protein